MVWFAVARHMTAAKNGVSAKTLHRILGLVSYQTVWAMLDRFRSATVRPGRDRLAGEVEVNELFIGGVKPGKRGRGAEGEALVAVALGLSTKGSAPDSVCECPSILAFSATYKSTSANLTTLVGDRDPFWIARPAE